MSVNYEELKRAMKESVRETVREEVRESLKEQIPRPEKVEISEEELTSLKAELENSKKTIETLKKEENKKPTKKSAPEPKEPEPSKPSVEETHGHEEGKPHYIGAWQQYCPTCGDKNPDFKDETQCEDCGAHLGAKETAEKLKACPNCGGHSAKKL